MKRRLAVVGLVVIALVALVVAGPARLRPWDCREIATADSATGAVTAYYDSCWDRPYLVPVGMVAQPEYGLEAYDGTLYADVRSFGVRYGDGTSSTRLLGRLRGDRPTLNLAKPARLSVTRCGLSVSS